MKVFTVEEIAIPELQNVLMWDAIEGEWRIGHVRSVIAGAEPYFMACTVEEANDALSDDEPTPLMIFTEVTHWARLPDEPGLPA